VRNLIARSGRAQHLSLKQSFVDCEPEGLCVDLDTISVCIHNVRTWLLIRNNYQEENLTYKTYNPEIFRRRTRTTEASSDPKILA
jgi:hypothetical protein